MTDNQLQVQLDRVHRAGTLHAAAKKLTRDIDEWLGRSRQPISNDNTVSSLVNRLLSVERTHKVERAAEEMIKERVVGTFQCLRDLLAADADEALKLKE